MLYSYLEYLMPLNHGVIKKAPTIVSTTAHPNQVFTRFVVLQVIIYQPSFDLI